MLDFLDYRKKPIDIFAGRGSGDYHLRVVEEKNLRTRLFDYFPRRLLFAASRSNQVPFVQDDDGWLSCLLNQPPDSLVLCRHADGQIDNKNAKISPANAAFGTHHAENFSRAGNLSAPADSGSVNENELPAIPFINYIDRVACCAGQLADDRTFAAYDGVY
jgi:hypothetical protein